MRENLIGLVVVSQDLLSQMLLITVYDMALTQQQLHLLQNCVYNYYVTSDQH
ncbi:hypothetical protein D3C79_983590 [compost metagenome]